MLPHRNHLVETGKKPNRSAKDHNVAFFQLKRRSEGLIMDTVTSKTTLGSGARNTILK
jgi:hypothetical protein